METAWHCGIIAARSSLLTSIQIGVLMLPTLYCSDPLLMAPVTALADATRQLWLDCRAQQMPLERADALVFEPTATGLAAAHILSRNTDIVNPRNFVLARGYFVAKVMSIHSKSVVLLFADTTTHTASRGKLVESKSMAHMEFHSTYKRAVVGHFMFRRLDDGATLQRIAALPDATHVK